jgi:hypothetical protein
MPARTPTTRAAAIPISHTWAIVKWIAHPSVGIAGPSGLSREEFT